MQEHPVRRSAVLGPRHAHHRRWTNGLRACLMRAGYTIKGGTAMSPEAWLPVAFVIGYLFGSLPFGLILTKLAGTQDLRSIGSGNIGATNVLRTGHKGLAAATLICDMLKGTVAVIIAGTFGGPNAAMLAALGAFLGHLFPVWLKFRGGKGVAVYIGVLLGLFWPAALVFCLIWLATAFNSRYSSLLALVGSFVMPNLLWVVGAPPPSL